MTAWQANLRATSLFGSRYQPAREFIRNSSAVHETYGDIKEIRPAVGSNYYSSWMDSTAVFLTFRVIGVRGEGVALIQGYNCYDLQLVFKGIPFDGGRSYVCP